MARIKLVLSSLACCFALNAHAGVELVCEGDQPRSEHKVVKVDCLDREDVLKKVGGAWQLLRKNGSFLEDMCWKAYQQAKKIPPQMSMQGIAGNFIYPCTMGLAELK